MKHIKSSGFTLIELMIVVAIIGILASIAIPYFNSYRAKSFNAAAISDLKNLSSAEEAFYTDNSVYAYTDSIIRNRVIAWGKGFPIQTGYLSGLYLDGTHPKISVSNGVLVCANVETNKFTVYTLVSKHTQGNRMYFMESDFSGIYYATDTSTVFKSDIGLALNRVVTIKLYASTGRNLQSKVNFTRLP